MTLSRRAVLGGVAAAAALPVARARAQAPKIRIGVLNDQSGPYRNTGGPTSVDLREAGGGGVRRATASMSM